MNVQSASRHAGRPQGAWGKVVAVLGLLLILSTGAPPAAAMSDDDAPFLVEFITPDPQRPNPKFSDLLPLVTTAGWTLTLKVDGRNAIGIGQALQVTPYPGNQQTAFLVYEDPDGCFSPTCDFFGPAVCGLDAQAACPARDETMVEFTTDSDGFQLPDVVGNSTVRDLLAGPIPTINVFDGEVLGMGNNSLPIKIGPESTAGDPFLLDGWGPGPDDDLPGLVLLIDSGFGLEYDAQDLDMDGDNAEVSGARNLAGLSRQVGYTLSSSRHGGANLYTQFQINGRMTGARVLLDEGVGPDGCNGQGALIRVNGGAPIALPSPAVPDGFDVPFDPVITVRAFLVNGTAPARLDDLDGNGVFDSADAALAGYAVISNEATIEIEQYYQFIADFLAPQRFDIDGNGFALCSLPVGPGGPGNITPTPR